MSKTDFNTVAITIGDNEHNLRFTLKAVKRIEQRLGGLMPAMQEVQRFNLGAFVTVIAAGAGLALKPSEVEALEEAIYQQGMITISSQLIEYISGLLNPNARNEDELADAAAKSEAGAKK